MVVFINLIISGRIGCAENVEVLNSVKKKRNTLYKVKQRKANWIGRILRKNRFRKTVIEGNIEWTGR